MGLFLSMSGVIGGNEGSVIAALRDYAAQNGGSMSAESLTTDDEACLVVSEGIGGVTILYPSDFFAWDDASKFLSAELERPVLSLHIHDGDLWMYLLFEDGGVIDQFNPVPDYWVEIGDEEKQRWRGDASVLAKCVPGLAVDGIERYLVFWGDEVFESDTRKKAYPSDEFYYGDDWQMIDFMKKLGLNYPLDDRGEPHGTTYRFACDPEIE